MDTTHCITNTDWERYAAGELAAKELHVLQAHAEACELCNDIKEGIDAMAQPAALKEKVAAINAGADKYLQRQKSRRMVLWYWSSAAAIVVAFGLGILLINKADEQITASEINKPAAVVESAHDSSGDNQTVTPGSKERSTPLGNNLKSNKAPGPEKETENILTYKVITDETNERPVEENKSLNKDIFKKEEIKPASAEESDFVLSEKLATIADTQLMVMTDAVTTETKKKTATLPAPNYMTNNATFSNNNEIVLNATGATRSFSWTFSDSAEYSNALVYYDSAKYDTCILTIKRVSESPASRYYEDALLLKAKALMKQGKKKEAKKVLKSVIALNGSRKLEAEGYLKTLK